MYASQFSLNNFDRSTVLIIGNYPIDEVPFKERNLNIEKVDIEKAISYLNNVKAIVIADFPSKYGLIKKCVEQIFPIADNYGVAKKILVHNDRDFLNVQAITKIESHHFYFSNKIPSLAETIARYNPGPPVKKIAIKCKIKLDKEIKLLLQRSFFDCEKIHVEAISGGKASMYLFKVHAWMKESEVGPLPLPFFAKIASHAEIGGELRNYSHYTDLYISFQYRPNCRLERCIHTKNYASLVGNFVDDAILLRAALQDRHHSGIIFSLFEKSLKGFRIQPFVSKREPLIGALTNFIRETVSIDRLLNREDIIAKANELGLKSDIKLMHDKLLNICPKRCLVGPIHGDLNSRNVMVRGNDAILIDFASIKYGPLTADPATLEISLSFEFDGKKPPRFKGWKNFIDEAYNPSQILKPLAFTEQVPNEFSWLRRALREIRHVLIGCDCYEEEIKAIIVCYLMRIARLLDKESKDYRTELPYRAYALVVAERIIDSLQLEDIVK